MQAICKCKNCGQILIDPKPADGNLTLDLEPNSNIQSLVHLSKDGIHGEWCCPICKTDEHIHDLKTSTYSKGAKTPYEIVLKVTLDKVKKFPTSTFGLNGLKTRITRAIFVGFDTKRIASPSEIKNIEVSIINKTDA